MKKKYNYFFILLIVFSLIAPNMSGFASGEDIEIEDPIPDFDAPIVLDVDVSSQNLTPSTPVKVIANLSDGEKGSGIKSATITYRKQNGSSKTFNFTLNSVLSQYEAIINVDSKDQEGIWEVDNIFLIDNKQNERRIKHSALSNSDDYFNFMKIRLNVSGTDKQTDFEAPILSSMSLHNQLVEAGDTIKLSVIATDNESGVSTIRAFYKKPSGKTEIINVNNQLTKNEYTGTHFVKAYDEPGEWILSYLELIDRAGNRKIYTSYVAEDGTNKNLSQGNVGIFGTTLDIEAPVMTNSFVKSNDVKSGESIQLTVEALDNFSGISSISAVYKKPSGSRVNISLVKVSESSNVYAGTYKVGQYDDLGSYELTSITLNDLAGNSILYDRQSQINQGKSMLELCDVIITETTPDYEAPILNGIEMIATKLSPNTAEVIFTAKPVDMISGVTHVSGRYTRPDNRSFNLDFNKVGNAYIAKIPIDRYDQIGKWNLTTLYVRDAIGNLRTINYAENDYFFTISPAGKLTIPPGVPYSIEINKDLKLNSGESYQLSPELKYTDGTIKNITLDSLTEYISSDPKKVTIGKTGLIKVSDTAKSSRVYITITYGEITSNVWISINGGLNDRLLEVTPLKINLSGGQQQQINVVDVNAGGRKDVTLSNSGITYRSINTDLATVSKNGLVSVSPNATTGLAIILVSYDGMEVEVKIGITTPTMKSLVISPSEEKLSLTDNSLQLIVKGFLSNGATKDVTNSNSGTIYSSSNKQIASVNSDGLVTVPQDAKSGEVTITAKNGSATAKTIIFVQGNPELIEVMIENLPEEIVVGGKREIKFFSIWSDGDVKEIKPEDVEVKSSREDRILISADGNFETLAVGTSFIDVKYMDISIRKTVMVIPGPYVTNLILEFPLPTLMKIDDEFNISGLKEEWSDGSKTDIVLSDASFTSSREDRVKITSDGKMIAIAKGTSFIDIKYNGKSIRTLVTVEAGATITDFYLESLIPPKLQVGKEYQISGLKAKWSDGSITDLSANDVQFTSSQEARVKVDLEGKMSALTAGTSYVDIHYAGKRIRTLVTVEAGATITDFYLESPNLPKLQVGKEYQISGLKAKWSDGSITDLSANDVQFTSSQEARVKVDLEGKMSALAAGTSYVDIHYAGKRIRTLVTVEAGATITDFYLESPIPPKLQVGKEYQISGLKAKWSDGSITDLSANDVRFTSSQEARVKVDLEGKMSALAAGTSYVDIHYAGKRIRTLVTVEAGATITDFYLELPIPPKLQVGKEYQISGLKAKWSDGSITDLSANDVQYTSSQEARVKVNLEGKMSALAAGTSYIDIHYAGKRIRTLVTIEN